MVVNRTPGPRFFEMRQRELARLRRLALRGDKHVAMHARAIAELSEGYADTESESDKRGNTLRAVDRYLARGGTLQCYTASAPSGFPTERRALFEPAWYPISGYISRADITRPHPWYLDNEPTGLYVSEGARKRAYRKVCGV